MGTDQMLRFVTPEPETGRSDNKRQRRDEEDSPRAAMEELQGGGAADCCSEGVCQRVVD